MNRKFFSQTACAVIIAAMLCGCGSGAGGSSSEEQATTWTSAKKSVEENVSVNEGSADEDTEPAADMGDAVEVTLNGDSAEISGDASGISADGGVITITAPGDYYFSGKLSDGSIAVAAQKTDKVELYLGGVDITSKTSAPIRIESADSCVIHLVEGTSNVLTDTVQNEYSACISAKDDITIKGKGSLTVNGEGKHGIKSSNDVKIKNGDITVSAVKAAVYGEDSVQITGGKLTVTACTDGIKASNTEEADKGFVTVEEADIDIQAASGNGIEAVTGVTVTSGSVNIHSDKQAINCEIQNIAEGCLLVQ